MRISSVQKSRDIFVALFYFTHDQSLDDESGIRLQQGIDQTSGQRGPAQRETLRGAKM